MADILLVDNDARIAELVAWFLRRNGHGVRTAPSFARARTEIAARRPDLMLSDLDLGPERGLEELPRLSEARLLPPTLVVSGYLDRASSAALARLPEIVGTLAKPFDLKLLEEHVAAALERATRVDPLSGDGPHAPRADAGWIELAPDASGDAR